MHPDFDMIESIFAHEEAGGMFKFLSLVIVVGEIVAAHPGLEREGLCISS